MNNPTPEPETAPTPDIANRISNYLQAGGLFNPEMMDHDKVRNLLMDSREAVIERDALKALIGEASFDYLARHEPLPFFAWKNIMLDSDAKHLPEWYQERYGQYCNKVRKSERTPDEMQALREDYERLKTQLRLCEEHAGTMAKDFDASLGVVRSELEAANTTIAAQEKEIAKLTARLLFCAQPYPPNY